MEANDRELIRMLQEALDLQEQRAVDNLFVDIVERTWGWK